MGKDRASLKQALVDARHEWLVGLSFCVSSRTMGNCSFRQLLFALIVGCAATAAAGEQVEITKVEVGFRGLYKVGLWTPVTITLQGGKTAVTGHLQVTVPDGDGLPSRVTSSKPVLAPAGGVVSHMLFARFGRIESSVDVRLVDLKNDTLLARRELDSSRDPDEGGLRWALFSAQELLVSLGSGIGLEDAIRLQRREPTEAIEHAALESVEQLPTRWFGYEGVQAVILSTSHPEMYRRLTGSTERLEALDQWVQRGGRLIITSAANASELLGSKEGPLARFAPGEFDADRTTLDNTADLEAFAEVQEPLPLGRLAKLRVARFTDLRGVVQAPLNERADLPLVVTMPYGFGQVVFVAVDLDQPPFVTWKARGNFVSKLLGHPARGSEDSAERSAAAEAATTGLTDLAGQLRGALDQFEGVKLVPFFVVASLVFGYILLIGPGDYFFVKRVLKRMEWTWITFPLIVLVVSGGAYVLASQLKGRELRLNQVDVVDVCLDPRTPLVRGTSWMNVFSPRADAYDLAYTPQLARDGSDVEVLLTWLGMPGSALGGMDPRSDNRPLTDRPYDHSPDLSTLKNVPIHVWSTKSLTSRWSASDPGLLDAQLFPSGDGGLTGALTSRLHVPIDECWLVYGRWVYPLGTLRPGEELDLGPRWKDREVLLSRLTRNRVEKDELRNQYVSVATPYDPGSFDIPSILKQMMFYGAAGGQGYVGLLHRYQQFVDLSELRDLNRGILFGFCQQPAGELSRLQGDASQAIHGPQDVNWTCYRFVIPIEKSRDE